jgi:hypothetical protein
MNAILFHKCNLFHKTTFLFHKFGTQDLLMFPSDPNLRTTLSTFLSKFLRAAPAPAQAGAAPATAG